MMIHEGGGGDSMNGVRQFGERHAFVRSAAVALVVGAVVQVVTGVATTLYPTLADKGSSAFSYSGAVLTLSHVLVLAGVLVLARSAVAGRGVLPGLGFALALLGLLSLAVA